MKCKDYLQIIIITLLALFTALSLMFRSWLDLFEVSFKNYSKIEIHKAIKVNERDSIMNAKLDFIINNLHTTE